MPARRLSNLFHHAVHETAVAAFTLIVLLTGCAAPAREPYASPTHQFNRFAVAADHEVASRAGAEMLQQGGNAVDAAVATSFTLSVVRPYSCGLGGGGFMVIYDPGRDDQPARSIAINYREMAPSRVGPDFYESIDDPFASRFGYRASGVPGTVAGLLHALDRYGTLDLHTVLAPAIHAAEAGFAADQSWVSAARTLAARLQERPELRDQASYMLDEVCRGGALNVGDIIRNPRQAEALRLIASFGVDAFYHDGPIGYAIAQAMAQHGGTITREDLAGYTVRDVEPLRGTFDDHEIIAMPPPSSGGIAMLQMFGMLDARPDDVARLARGSADYIHFITETMKHAFADRAQHLADPDFVDVPIDTLLSDDHILQQAWSISMTRTMPAAQYGDGSAFLEDTGTSHFSIIDEDGMAVACTETINLVFGSLIEVPGFGFFLNNEMDDFTAISGQANEFGLRQSDDNMPEPGKRPLSSMSPTIVVKDGQALMIAGASGGPRIITGTMQVLLNSILYDMSAGGAVGALRFHHQWLPDRLDLERRWRDPNLRAVLGGYGHDVGTRDEVGNVQFIRVRDDSIEAASDPRKGGRPAGE